MPQEETVSTQIESPGPVSPYNEKIMVSLENLISKKSVLCQNYFLKYLLQKRFEWPKYLKITSNSGNLAGVKADSK